MIILISINKNVSNELIINKSKFITFLIRVHSLKDIETALNDLNKLHSRATHLCYAYIIGNIKRFHDAGEPSGTAGKPILNVLENNNLNYILGVVIRYFGGIKLGTGGLTRAYSNSISKAIEQANFIQLVPGKKIEIEFSYEYINEINNLLNDFEIIDKNFGVFVNYLFLISNENFLNIKNRLNLFVENLVILDNLLIIKKNKFKN